MLSRAKFVLVIVKKIRDPGIGKIHPGLEGKKAPDSGSATLG
jgi:hypothetical protein